MKILLALIFLTACSLEPRYCRPIVNPPSCWKVPSDEIPTEFNERFWETLGDPVLNALVLEALRNNRDLQVAAWRVIQFYGQFLEVRSSLFPQIDFQATALREKFSYVNTPATLPGGAITNFYSYEFNLSYQIDLWGALRNATRAACQELLASVENRREVVLTLVSAVADSYILLRQFDRQLAISKATVAVREEAVRIATDRWLGGVTSEIEVTQSISLLDQARAAVVTLEEQIPIQENLISVLIGKNPSEIWRGREIDAFCFPPVIPTGLPSTLLVNRPDILAAEHLLIASNAQIGVARAAFFPQLTLTGLFGASSFELKKLFTKPAQMWQIGGTLFQPIFTGGMLTGQLIEAIAENKQAYYGYQQTVLTAFQQVDDALISHQQAKELVLVEEHRVQDLRLYLELSWYRYYEGTADYLVVLNASQELFNAELDLASAQGKVFTTLIDIFKATGGGWVWDADTCLRKLL